MRALLLGTLAIAMWCSPIPAQVENSESNCAELNGADDGVPAEYAQESCLAKLALERQEWPKAEKHLRNALAVQIFEAPNYDLMLELGLATCHLGRIADGKAVLSEFICLANADLGNVRCEAHGDEQPKSACQRLACDGTGSSLSAEGRDRVGKRLVEAARAMKECDGA